MQHANTGMRTAGNGKCGYRSTREIGSTLSISPAVREASRAKNYGKVIELVRKSARMTQTQLGQACGLSQSAVSRLEKRGHRAYATDVLALMATHLSLPASLLGLADAVARDGYEHVDRRQFMGGTAAAAAAPILSALPDPGEGTGQAATLRLGTASYRRLDASTPSRELTEVVQAHLRLVQTVSRATGDDRQRARLAAVASEAASLVGWLSWDMGDHGSARSWYASAVRAARAAGEPLLAAYQAGSMAQFEADAGNGDQALAWTSKARTYLAAGGPLIADAWLLSVEAVAHAAVGNERATDKALTASRTSVSRLRAEDPAPWPWVFHFSEAKVAAARVNCGARLGLSGWVLDADTTVLATGHAKQRALLLLDIAAGHLAAGRVEAAFALASRALDAGVQYRSGRIVDRARAVRRSYRTASPPKVVREFDERLHDVHL
ncbi:helix-turn-helix domain-containing protein [Streptomyces sp. NPDC098789]|uniref:helix-turn-helix domain-containing protein n=1 Tax=Streptomyces sp. NPDC098789 TaxID=3366098 RepID=UPI00381C8A92